MTGPLRSDLLLITRGLGGCNENHGLEDKTLAPCIRVITYPSLLL